MDDYGPSQAQSGLGALVTGLGQGFSSQQQAQNQQAMQQAYMNAMFGGRQALQDQSLAAKKAIDDANNQRAVQVAAMRPSPANGGIKFDIGTQRIINHAPNYQRVYNDYTDLYNQVNNTDDPAQKEMLEQQALAHGKWTAPVNTWMSDSPDLTPDQRAAGQKIKELTLQAQQAGAGQQLRLMHAMETLNQQTGSMRPASPEMVQHVYDTTPGLDAPKGQFAYMMGTQADSAVPWEGMAINAKLQGKDPGILQQEASKFKQGFHQVNSVPYDADNRPQTTDFGYGQPAKNGVAPMGSPAPTPSTSPPPTGLAAPVAPGAQAPAPSGGTAAPNASRLKALGLI